MILCVTRGKWPEDRVTTEVVDVVDVFDSVEEEDAEDAESVDVDRIVEVDVAVCVDVEPGMVTSEREGSVVDEDEDVDVDVLLISVFVVDAGSAGMID